VEVQRLDQVSHIAEALVPSAFPFYGELLPSDSDYDLLLTSPSYSASRCPRIACAAPWAYAPRTDSSPRSGEGHCRTRKNAG
jgi:hypothetical protein